MQRNTCKFWDVFGKRTHAKSMTKIRAMLLPQPNRNHFHDSAFDRTMKLGMRFNPSDRNDIVT